MKRLLFFSLTICLYLACSKSNSNSGTPPTTQVDTLNNWVKTNSAGFELDDIWFTDIKTGFVVAATSIFSSTDSGNTWTGVPNTSNFKVYNIQFLDNLHGFVQGSTQLG